MPRIPVYNSRVSAPGPIPGVGDDLAAPGRALARFGAAIAGFGENLARYDARKAAAERMRQMQEAEADRNEPRDESVDTPDTATPEEREEAARKAGDRTAARLDEAHDDALVAVMRADALNQASMDADPEQLTARALAYFDAAAAQLIDGAGDADRRARLRDLVRRNRAVLVDRAEHRRRGHMATILNEKLTTALAGYADAARRDTAMLPAILQKGADAIAGSAHLAGLGPERVAAMTTNWMKQAHVALVEGTIERDPALALTSLESGGLDAPLGNDTATIGRLTRRAEIAVAEAEAARTQRKRTQRSLFEVDKAEHLERIRRTGRGDPEFAARADDRLNPDERAAFDADVAAAETHYAARRRYAFMKAEEIDADIADKAPGGGPRDTDELVRDHQARIAARDEILAERSRDSAGWAMRDETVSQAFAAAEEAAELAAKSGAGPANADQADRLYRRAIALRLQVQADMGETPRLLTESERETLAAELQSLSPTERLARIGELQRRYGAHYATLMQELAGRIAPDTETLMTWSGDSILAGMLARGMEMESVEFKRAPYRSLPLPGGRIDTSRLEDRRLYRFKAAGRTVDVAYDRKADALVPTFNLTGSIQEQPSAETDLATDTPGVGQAAPVPTLIGEGSLGLPDEQPTTGQDPSKIRTGRDVVEKVKKGSAFTQAVKLTDDELSQFSQNNKDGVRALRHDGEIVFSLGDDDVFLSLPSDAAAYVIRNWDSYRSRLAILSNLQDASLSPEALRRLVEDEVYKGIPEHLRNRMGGPGWIAIEGGDPDELGQRAAATKLKAYDDLVAALEAGESEESLAELFENFQQALLPELLGWGAVFSDIVKDLVPGLGNFRSGIHAWNDLIEIANDFNDGDLLGLLGNSGMLLLDTLGVIPAVNSAFAPVRIAVKSGGRRLLREVGRAPVGRMVTRWRARYRLAKYLRTTTDTLKSRSIEEYFTKVWKDLPPRMQEVLRRRFQFFVGRAGELKTASEAGDAGFDVVDDLWRRRFNVTSAKTRIFDFLTEQDFNTVWNDWFVVPGKSKSGRTTGVEVKVNLSKYLKHQKDADEDLVKNTVISASQVMRLPAEVIKPEDLAAAIDEWLKRPWRKDMENIGGVAKRELEDLVKTLQRPGDLTVGQLFGLTLVYVLGRYGEPDKSEDGLMMQPAAMP